MLSASYTDEQAKLTETLPQRESEIRHLKETVSNTVAFLDKAKRYTDIQELTPELLRLFIQKIVVHEKEVKWSKHAPQTVEIHYADIGCMETDKQQNRNSTTRSRKYPEPFPAIHRQKTRLVPEAPAGYPHRRCYPCQGAANRSPGFSHFRAFAADFPAKRRACRPLFAGSKPFLDAGIF